MSLKNYIFASINTKSTSSYRNHHVHAQQIAANQNLNNNNELSSLTSSPSTTTTTAQTGNNNQHNLSYATTRRGHSNNNDITMPPVSEENNRDEDDDDDDDPRSHTSMGWIRKVWKFISVEPVMIAWILPSCLLYIAIENLALEKSCRVNFGYDDIVCDNMIDKSINNINCVEIRIQESTINDTNLLAENAAETKAIINATNYHSINITESLSQLKIDVCHAEIDSQILDSALNVYTSPFDSVFGIIMILFAGGWSDRKGTRKPCMLLPLIGELASLIVLLTASIFMKQLPLEFNSIGSKLFPAITGGSNLMLMGVYSYLTEMTDEKDRTFRFGIFAVFMPLIPIASVPFSGILFQKLRYIKLILLCIPINIIGILYIIFVLKESKSPTTENASTKPQLSNSPTDISGIDNVTFDMAELENKTHKPRPSCGNLKINSSEMHHRMNIRRNCLVEFFNPIVAIDCLRVILRKRENNGRMIVAILLVMYFVATGPAFGEEPNEYNFTRIKLNWDGLKYSPFATYGNAISLVGTILMVGGLSKLFKLSDPLVGFLGTFFSSIARIVYAAATTATMLYIARTIDMFVSVRALTIKSIISTFVETAELGRIFSIIGIIEAFGKFVFVSGYSIIYKNTLETVPGAFYICSLFCLILTAILFVILYFIVRNKKKREDAVKAIEAITDRHRTGSTKTILPGDSSISSGGSRSATIRSLNENDLNSAVSTGVAATVVPSVSAVVNENSNGNLRIRFATMGDAANNRNGATSTANRTNEEIAEDTHI